jgi:hypothetical protein
MFNEVAVDYDIVGWSAFLETSINRIRRKSLPAAKSIELFRETDNFAFDATKTKA